MDYENSWSDPFSDEQFSGAEWIDRVMDGIHSLNGYRDAVVTILAHPACMSLVESFDVFERLCTGLSNYEVVTMRELLD